MATQELRQRKGTSTGKRSSNAGLVYIPDQLHHTIGNLVAQTAKKVGIGDAFISTSGTGAYSTSPSRLRYDSVKCLYWMNAILLILHLGSPIAAFITYWFYVPKMSDHLLTMDPTLYDTGLAAFAVTLKVVGSYKIAILLLIPTLVAGIFCAVKIFSIPYDVISDTWLLQGQRADVENIWKDVKWGVYLETIESGVFSFTWIYCFLAVGAFTWTIASICGVTNVFIIVLLIGCIWAVVYTGWLHEVRNHSIDGLNREEAERNLQNTGDDFISSIIQWKFWDAFIFGGLIHLFYWTVLFVYFGFMAASRPTFLPWWQWTVPFVAFFFFAVFCGVLAYYTAANDSAYSTGYNIEGSATLVVTDLKFQHHVNKEIWTSLIIALCSQSVLWITFAGMLSTN